MSILRDFSSQVPVSFIPSGKGSDEGVTFETLVKVLIEFEKKQVAIRFGEN